MPGQRRPRLRIDLERLRQGGLGLRHARANHVNARRHRERLDDLCRACGLADRSRRRDFAEERHRARLVARLVPLRTRQQKSSSYVIGRQPEHLLGLGDGGVVVAERRVRARDSEHAARLSAVERGGAAEAVESFLRFFGQELDFARQNRDVHVLLVALGERSENLFGSRKLRLDGRLRSARKLGLRERFVGRDLGELLFGVGVDLRPAPVAKLGGVPDERTVGEKPSHPRVARLRGVDERDGSVRIDEGVTREKLLRGSDGRRCWAWSLSEWSKSSSVCRPKAP